MRTIGAVGILAIGSFFDIRWKKIPAVLLVSGGLLGIGILIWEGVQKGVWSVFLNGAVAIAPGTGLLLLSFLTEKKVGSGDGFLVMIIGLLQGIGRVLTVFCIGLFLQSLGAVVLLLLKKADKQTCIPFVPFLLCAEVVMCFW